MCFHLSLLNSKKCSSLTSSYAILFKIANPTRIALPHIGNIHIKSDI